MNDRKQYTDNLIKEVLETKSLDILYQREIECSQDIALLKTRQANAETTNDQLEASNDLMIYHSILSSIKNRIPDLKKELEEESEKEKSRDYKFRMAAKYILTPLDYGRVMEETKLFAREIRERAEIFKK